MTIRPELNKIYVGDAREVLKTWPDSFVHCAITSPPYFQLRDYKVAGQIGLEKSADEYIQKLVDVFREVRRVLRDDGTLWVNIGDTYAGRRSGRQGTTGERAGRRIVDRPGIYKMGDGIKNKDLIGIPWRLALALQKDGWVLRQDVIWSKPNCIPSSVRDRCTLSHEYIFMFSKAKWVGRSPGRFASMSDQDARWIAMFLDTEGNICAKRTYIKETGVTMYGTQIAFANTSLRLLEAAQAIVGHGTILTRPGKNAPIHYYQLCGREAADLLLRIYPFLIVKQRQAALAVHMQDILSDSTQERKSKAGQLRGRKRSDAYTEKLERIWTTMKSLNHFGNPDLSWVPKLHLGHWDSQPYYFDSVAIEEPQNERERARRLRDLAQGACKRYKVARSEEKLHPSMNPQNGAMSSQAARAQLAVKGTRNKRTVWTVATTPFKKSHFATFPQKLVEPMIKAGTGEKGCCRACGTAMVRVVERGGGSIGKALHDHSDDLFSGNRTTNHTHDATYFRRTAGWRFGCKCPEPGDLVPGIILDPFAGAGTTCLVARKLGRDFLGIELNPNYAQMAEDRIREELGMFA